MKKILFLILAVAVVIGCNPSPQTSGELVFRGESYHKDGNIEKAIKTFNKAIKINPNNLDAYSSRGTAYFFDKKYQKAVNDFAVVAKYQPTNYQAFNALASAMAGLGDYDNALKIVNRSIYMNPNNAEAFFTRGGINISRREYKQAIGDYSVVIKMRPFADAYISRAFAYKFLEMEKEYQQDMAMAKKPGMPQHINYFVAMDLAK